MHTIALSAASLAPLLREDLVAFEPLLKEHLARFATFKSATLFFPRQPPQELLDETGGHRAVHLRSERKIMLPLVHGGELLAVLLLKGVTLKSLKAKLEGLPAVATACLELLHLRKIAACDALTGLAHRQHFLELAARELEMVAAAARPLGDRERRTAEHPSALGQGMKPGMGPGLAVGLPEGLEDGLPWRASVGVVALRLRGLDAIIQEAGHCFAEQALRAVAQVCRVAAPETAMRARVDERVFAVFLRDATPRLCRETAQALAEALAQAELDHALSGRRWRLDASFGYACFPQDMDGRQIEKIAPEQARLLLDRAVTAAKAAAELGPGGILGFRQVLEEGGSVARLLPMHRCTISLGSSLGAQEGQRFLIWAKDKPRSPSGANGLSPLYKGECLIMETSREHSMAEIMHLADATWPIEPGDRLSLVKDVQRAASVATSTSGEPQRDMLTGLLLYRDFLDHLTKERERQEIFSLALLRTRPAPVSPHDDQERERFSEHAEQMVGEAASLAREILGPEAVGGRHSLNSCIFFHPGLAPEETLARHRVLAEQLLRLGVQAAVGVAGHPFLSYRKSDVLENCRKALDYSLLLPAPHLGLCDSLALTINADKLFSQNDLFHAMEEYQLALLADASNNLARISLGVCEARLGRLPQARARFEEALARDPADAKALYNLGCVCLRLGEKVCAKDALTRCLALEPENLYALLRLGQLAEQDGALVKAGRLFKKAAALEGGEPLTRRSLARLCYKQGRLDEARDHLHEALSNDPKDAHALSLMARLYLDTGDDPEVAKLLATQSVALMPGHKPFWVELARAFEALGKPREAQDSLAKASGL